MNMGRAIDPDNPSAGKSAIAGNSTIVSGLVGIPDRAIVTDRETDFRRLMIIMVGTQQISTPLIKFL
jgi:hypothetical protein